MKGSLPLFLALRSCHRSVLRHALRALVLSVLLLAHGARAQTVVLNEVSNGPAGSMEYMELVVVPDAPLPPCQPPPCLDLRGWMIDDNNGYHGAGGVAAGAARFADHPLWTCVPLGTVIVVYNGADPNPALPPTDVSLSDGNCSIVISAMDLTYFEFTNNTPAAVPCDQPGGWGDDPNPTWEGNMAFANSGDCARVADAAGCEVFSLCYGNTTQNATVAFTGQGGDKVWSFNQGDPTNAANWSTGCAGDINACGADDQTPGGANNAANAAWLAGFNNGCQPYVDDPLAASATATPACGCNGSATASGQGASTPYTFQWHAADWTPVPGADLAVISDRCGGTYHVIVTSANGCVDTATTVINTVLPPDAGTNGALALCAASAPVDLFTALGGTPQATGTWSPAPASGSVFDPAVDPPGIYTYTVAGTAPCADAVAEVVVTLGDPPVIIPTTTDVSCAGADDGSISVVVQPAGTYVYAWSDGLPPNAAQNGLAGGEYTVSVEDGAGCAASATITLSEPLPLVITVTTENATCDLPAGSACATISGGSGPFAIGWNDPQAQTTACATALLPATYSVTANDANGCTASATAVITGPETSVTVSETVDDVDCAGLATGAIALSIVPAGAYAVTWNGPGMADVPGTAISGLAVGAYTYAFTTDDDCTVSGTVVVSGPPPLSIAMDVMDETCAGLCDGALTVQPIGGTAPWQLLVDAAPQPPGTINDLCAGAVLIDLIDANGCALDTSITINEGAELISAAITPVDPVCATASAVPLNATPVGGTWQGAGIVDPALGTFDPQAAGTGTHTIVYAVAAGCVEPANTVVVVTPAPEAAFVPPVDLENAVQVSSIGLHATTFLWTLDGETVGTDATVSLPAGTFAEAAPDRTLCLTVGSTEGCTDTHCVLLRIPTTVSVHVPNAFSPNDDGINDRFAPTLTGTAEGSLFLIFDRWGSVLHQAVADAPGWDGRARGAEAPQGVYPWRLEVPGLGAAQVWYGHVTLIR